MKKLLSFDIGIKNPSYSIFTYSDTDFSIQKIISYKDDWTLFDKSTIQEIIDNNKIQKNDTIIIERQRTSRMIYFVGYIKGYFEALNFMNVKVVQAFTHGLGIAKYKDRKKYSINLFKLILFNNSLNYKSIKKLDDISDSFNLGIIYITKMKKNNKKKEDIINSMENIKIENFELKINIK